MNRNTPSRFALAPQVNIERSTFPMHPRRLTSFDVGQCIPTFCAPVLPGDTWKCKTSYVARMQTLKTPVMDDIQLSKYWFFVPDRLLWTHFEEFMGANKTSAWIPSAEYILPQITAPDGGWAIGSIADHLGVPPLVDNLTVKNALRFRAYSKIMNDWFVSDSIMDPIVMETGDSTVSGSNGTNYITDVDKGGMPFVACRNHDMFSSCLFEPQRGPDVSINAFVDNQQLPVYAIGTPNEHFQYGDHADPDMAKYKAVLEKSYPLMFETDNPKKFGDSQAYAFPYFLRGATAYGGSTPYYQQQPLTSTVTSGLGASVPDQGSDPYPKTVVNTTNKQIYAATNRVTGLTPINLIAESSGKYLWTSINDLRQAFQVQRFYEKAARAGSGRYIEIIRAHFGVTSPDARLQRSEYLGGNTRRLNVRQITQTSSTVDTSPMGDVAGMSVTGDYDFDFEKSFTEHGYLMCIVVARYNHTYQQGMDPDLLRSGIFSMYWPSFAHLGEQPVPNACIYVQGYDSTDPSAVDYDSQVFGYQEAWYDYRWIPNSVSSMMRSVSNSGLDSWHYADKYDSLPYLSASWLQEDKTNVDRALAVSSAVSNQIFADFQFDITATRPMPLYSIPGLIDHF